MSGKAQPAVAVKTRFDAMSVNPKGAGKRDGESLPPQGAAIEIAELGRHLLDAHLPTGFDLPGA